MACPSPSTEVVLTVVSTPTRRPAAHLTPEDIEAIGAELDAIRERIIESRGERDAAYIRRVIAVQRALELGGRVILLAGKRRSAWWIGTASLSLAKILENMEIGHNVLHGQWDWMRDPKIHSSTWDWDHSSPPEQCRRGAGVAAAAPGPARRQLHHRVHLRAGHRDVRRRPG
jgi:NADPH-dependent stearoyl-CoA 9-desaturase